MHLSPGLVGGGAVVLLVLTGTGGAPASTTKESSQQPWFIGTATHLERVERARDERHGARRPGGRRRCAQRQRRRRGRRQRGGGAGVRAAARHAQAEGVLAAGVQPAELERAARALHTARRGDASGVAYVAAKCGRHAHTSRDTATHQACVRHIDAAGLCTTQTHRACVRHIDAAGLFTAHRCVTWYTVVHSFSPPAGIISSAYSHAAPAAASSHTSATHVGPVDAAVGAATCSCSH